VASSIGVNAGSKVDGGGDWNRGSDSQAAYAAAAWLQGADLNESLSQFLNPMALFCLREFQGCRSAAERAISHNPMDGTILAGIGMMLAYSGDWVRRCALAERAAQLNPRHPGWYWIPLFFDLYRECDYRDAVAIGLRFNMPGFLGAHAAMAAAYGQLGESEAARRSLNEVLRLAPAYARSARERLAKWFGPELVDHILDGLRKAGLQVSDGPAKPKSSPVTPASGTAAAPAHSIAVLPFANMSGDKEQEYFSDGLAEEIINLLAQTPVLKVIARASAFAFRGKEQDLRAIAATLGVGAILEGSVHRSGDRVRVTAQLISAEDGTHLFSERYDSVMADVLTLQDEIAVAITGALRIKLSESPGLPSYSPNTAAYEAFLKARYHEAKVTPDSLKLARQYYERNISLDPGFALAHVGLAITTWSRRTGGRGTRPNGPCCSIRPCRKLTPCSV
jgi:TolB-like protein